MAYGKQQRYRLAQMRAAGVEPFIEASIVREHLRMLMEAKYKRSLISRVAGVSDATVYRLIGTPTVPPTRWTRREVADRILAVTPERILAAGTGYVDGTGTHRRLQALVALGWSQAQLSERAGWRRNRVTQILAERLVHSSTAAVVRDLYDGLCLQVPRADDQRSRISVNRSRRYAAAHGWPPPLAWDDDIDDPAAKPADGWKRTARIPAAGRAEDARELLSLGVLPDVIAERFEIDPKSLQRLLERHREVA